jgi:hypothetical protein
MKLLSSDAVTKVQRLELESSFDDYFYSGYRMFICFSDHEDSDPIGILKDFYTFGIAARQLLYLQ